MGLGLRAGLGTEPGSCASSTASARRSQRLPRAGTACAESPAVGSGGTDTPGRVVSGIFGPRPAQFARGNAQHGRPRRGPGRGVRVAACGRAGRPGSGRDCRVEREKVRPMASRGQRLPAGGESAEGQGHRGRPAWPRQGGQALRRPRLLRGLWPGLRRGATVVPSWWPDSC